MINKEKRFFVGGFIQKVPGGPDIVKVKYSPEALQQSAEIAIKDATKSTKGDGDSAGEKEKSN